MLRDFFVAVSIKWTNPDGTWSARTGPVWNGRVSRPRSALRAAQRAVMTAVAERPNAKLESVRAYWSIDCPHRPTLALRSDGR